jgi:hypothetical protein
LRIFAVACTLVALAVCPAGAERYTYVPTSDFDDGQLINGSSWDYGPVEFAEQWLYLSLGREGTVTYDNALAFGLPDLSESQVVSDVRLRLNQQGGVITSGLEVEISAALDLDPLATPAPDRFALPRTTATVAWNITASWDSSSQKVAKWAETPDLSPIINELLALSGWDAGPKNVCVFLEMVTAVGDNVVRFDDTHGEFWNGGNPSIEPARLIVAEGFRDAFWGRELLCRPKPYAMDLNIVPHVDADAYVEWGTDGVSFPNSTAPVLITGGTAHHFVMTGLTSDTRYYYRLQSRAQGAPSYETGPVYSFLTLPLAGGESRICVTSDIHVTNTTALGLQTHLDLLRTSLDYMPTHETNGYHAWLDLGDLVVMRPQRTVFDIVETEQRYRQAREWIESIAHSMPFVQSRGNHEEVNGWDYDATPENITVWSGKNLVKYFPPPFPDEFYSGNSTPFPEIGIPGNYFSMRIGNVTLRGLDPYLNSMTRPHNAHNQTGGSKNGWDWELGDDQYLWLHDEITQNPGTYNIVSMHHLTSCYDRPGYWYGRGGIETVDWDIQNRPTFEWGGIDSLGVNVMATERPGYIYGPVHDMLVSAGNQVVIKGHDHFYGLQQLDGMYYATLPKPNDTGEHTGDLWGFRFACEYPDSITDTDTNSGFLSIVADELGATFEYIQTFPSEGLGNVRDSFTVFPPTATGVGLGSPGALRSVAIRSVSPNPSRSSSRIEYEIPDRGPVRLSIYDAAGRLVRHVVDDDVTPGIHTARWDGRDRSGRRVAAGVYFAKLRTTRGRTDAVKMILVR